MFQLCILSQSLTVKHVFSADKSFWQYLLFCCKIYDEIIQITNEEAYDTAKKLAKVEGILSGISSGAALNAGLKIAERSESENKNILVFLPDTLERYLSLLS